MSEPTADAMKAALAEAKRRLYGEMGAIIRNPQFLPANPAHWTDGVLAAVLAVALDASVPACGQPRLTN